ncbi:MAG: DNA-3-methyladenine glycosylase I [Moritella dasanensis]|jgi:DNA-3-methyladenine glycosylase I
MKQRCRWPGEIPIYIDCHDSEWGIPVHDDNHLF